MDPLTIAIITSVLSPLLVGFINTVVLRPLQALPGKVDALSNMMMDLAEDLEDAHERLADLEATRVGDATIRPSRRRRVRRPYSVQRG